MLTTRRNHSDYPKQRDKSSYGREASETGNSERLDKYYAHQTRSSLSKSRNVHGSNPKHAPEMQRIYTDGEAGNREPYSVITLSRRPY